MAKKQQVEEDDGPSQEWLASYADAMTLLLAFFIMMFAFALIDENKFDEFKVGVAAALGIPDPATDSTDSILGLGTGITPEVGLAPIDAKQAAENADLLEALAAGQVTPENAEELREFLEKEFDEAGASQVVEVGIDERGVFIRFDGQVLFESGSAQLDDEGLALLSIAANTLGLIDNLIEVEGHTDSQPTGGEWPSNWELSTARASRVVRWLIGTDSVLPPQLRAVGLADTRPRGDNATLDGRQQNRRVEIVVRVPGIVDSDVDVIDPFADTGVDPNAGVEAEETTEAPVEETAEVPAGQAAEEQAAEEQTEESTEASTEPAEEPPVETGEVTEQQLTPEGDSSG